jgi:hypothetical protein
MLILSLAAEQLFVSQEILSYTELVRGEAGNEDNCITRSWLINKIYYYYYYYGSTALCWALAAFSSFLIPYTVGRTPWTGDQPAARPLPTHTT